MSKAVPVPILLTPSAELPASLAQERPQTVLTFRTFHEFAGSAQRPSYFVIGAVAETALAETLQAIRRHPLYFAAPVLLLNPVSAQLEALADGRFGSWPEAERRAKELNEVLSRLPEPAGDDQDARLLYFLYCRPDSLLVPHPDYHAPLLYRYPLLEAFHGGPLAQQRPWISSLINRSLLEDHVLVDRVRCCPDCQSAHLNYVDRCPNCESVDIREQTFLHCFSCGYVARQGDFLQGGTLQCPKCRAALRHIGSDYDHAMENFDCGSCAHVFNEAEIKASCLDCGSIHMPEELIQVAISSLRLSERGRVAVISGKIQDFYALFDQANYLAPEFFFTVLDWELKQHERYRRQVFSLLLISLDNVLELVTGIGRASTIVIMEELAERLRQALRDTDFSTRIAENRILVLLPWTDAEGIQPVLTRIVAFRASFRGAGAETLKLSTSRYHAPVDWLENETPELLLARMVQQLEQGF